MGTKQQLDIVGHCCEFSSLGFEPLCDRRGVDQTEKKRETACSCNDLSVTPSTWKRLVSVKMQKQLPCTVKNDRLGVTARSH